MLDFFHTDLRLLDPAVAGLIENEAERQGRKLILIPSESQAPSAVREALGSVFQNIYAEGYPDPSTYGMPEEEILDYEVQLAHYRRYSDLRYYKGVEYVNILEALARRRAAEAFATEAVPPEEIWANVQPLSGSPANSAIYDALVPLGSTVMGMDLTWRPPDPRQPRQPLGQVLPYRFLWHKPGDRALDYEEIETGATTQTQDDHRWLHVLPLDAGLGRFRQIADEVGAYLLADISHCRHGRSRRGAQSCRPCPRRQLYHPQDPVWSPRGLYPGPTKSWQPR